MVLLGGGSLKQSYCTLYSCCPPLVPVVSLGEPGHGYRHLFFIFSSSFLSSRHLSLTAFSINSLQLRLSSAVVLHPPTVSRSLFCRHIRAQWLRGRASDCRLQEPGFESCAAVLKPWATFVHSTYIAPVYRCTNEYLATDSDGYVYEQPSRINCSIWLRSRDSV